MLVAGTVAAVAVASVAGSLITGASAVPAPASPSAAGATAPGTTSSGAAGFRARGKDGAETTVLPATSPLVKRLSVGSPVAAAAPGAAAVTAVPVAAAVKRPAYTVLGRTGIVTSASQSLAFAPDGSRVAWATRRQVFTAHLDGSAVVATSPKLGAGRIAWSPDGRYLSLQVPGAVRVIGAAQPVTVPVTKRGAAVTVTSWLKPGVLLAPTTTGDALELVPVFGGTVIRSVPAAGTRVLDAVASPNAARIALRIRTTTGTPTESIRIVHGDTLMPIATVVTTPGQLGRVAWSRDSATVYVPRTEGGTTSIVKHSATTADGDPEVVVANAASAPHVYTLPVSAGAAFGQRLGGDVVAAAIAVSKGSFPTARGRTCSTVGAAVSAVVAEAGSVEATVAAPLAAHTCGPLLLTGSASLDKRTAAELKRLLQRGRTVHLVGGTASLSASVATAVTRAGFKAVRYAGSDVYGTAVQVATKGFKNHKVAAIASATQPMAAVVGAATGGAGDVPLLLTAGTRMPAVTDAYLDRYRVSAWVVGSQGVKAAPWAYRYTGGNDAATALAVANGFYYPPRVVTLVAPNAVGDAYVAAGFAAIQGTPVLVVTPTAVPAGVRTFLDRASASLQGVLLFGSTRAVSSKVLTDARGLARGRTLQ